MAKNQSGTSQEEEVELSKFEKLLIVSEIARDQYYREKFGQGTKQNNITASILSSSVPKDIGTSCFLKPQGEQVPKRPRSKATRGEPSLVSGFGMLNLKGYNVDDHDYLKDKEVPSGLCKFNGKRYADDHDYLYDKEVLLDRKGKKKLRNYDDDEDYEKEEKPRNKIVAKMNKVVAEIVPLPVQFENRIQEMGGDNVKLIIQKHLFKCDTRKDQNRFSIPIKQIRKDAEGFLTENEVLSLPITVPLIEPDLNLSQIDIRKWNYSGSSSYMLSGPWSAVRNRNKLQDGMLLQLWSFRVDGLLCLALVKVSRDDKQDHGINGIANTSQIQIHAESHNQQQAMEQIKSGNEADRQGASCSQAQGCSSSSFKY
ncbi:hypothetical protein POM88_010290 [Heracleum sosnowskyi]|uniref:B3 domain-containing protein n=1 Tax=Heracleum sosnowskyi TaxID=360622 RepID=A0AAD8MZT3_9APIA|nr:hypothetical protein POM88_010290 [Heracleum sosnowskyi]